MTGEELKAARLQLGVSGAAFGKAFGVHARTVRTWEGAVHDGVTRKVPLAVAVLVELALDEARVRRRLGFARKSRKSAKAVPMRRRDDHWSKRAEELRTIADSMLNPEPRMMMERLANDYDRMAERETGL